MGSRRLTFRCFRCAPSGLLLLALLPALQRPTLPLLNLRGCVVAVPVGRGGDVLRRDTGLVGRSAEGFASRRARLPKGQTAMAGRSSSRMSALEGAAAGAHESLGPGGDDDDEVCARTRVAEADVCTTPPMGVLLLLLRVQHSQACRIQVEREAGGRIGKFTTVRRLRACKLGQVRSQIPVASHASL
jgi:hypothetical protein